MSMKKVKCEFCSSLVSKHYSAISRSKKRHGSVISCGCENNNILAKEYLLNLRKPQNQFYLSFVQFSDLKKSPCYYCSDDTSGNLGLITNSRGFFIENTVPLCNSCMLSKGDKTHDEFVEYLNRITENVNRKKFGL